MRDVNNELRPLVRMTYPARCNQLSCTNADLRSGFRSWVLLLGLFPIDRHSFGFEEIADGERFSEQSTSWVNRSWSHRRSVTPNPTGDGSILRDVLVIEPRTRLLAPAARAGVAWAFRHRHNRLRRRFGETG